MRLQTLAAAVSAPAARALAVSGVLWLLVFTYSHYALWRDPHGAYFHSEHIYDLAYSAVRQQAARAFLQEHSNSSRAQHAGDSPALCAAFVTVRREHPEAARYFADAVGSMLEALSPRERAALNLTVLFANAADPALHPDFAAAWLPALVDHAAGYEGVSDAERAELRRLEDAHDFQRKGVLDYLYVLDRCYRGTRAPFIAVFEDDIIFAADWLARTLLALQHLATHDRRHPPWLYLRLFYTETFMAWDAAADWWYGHLFVTFALVSLTTATVLVLLRMLLRLRGGGGGGPGGGASPPAKSGGVLSYSLGLRLDLPTVAVLSAVVAPAFTALAFMAGKYNLPMYALHGRSRAVGNALLRADPVARQRAAAGVVPMDAQGCCSQALVFDRARVPDLMAHLRARGRGQTDVMIEEYCHDTPLRRFALGEQAVQHVGVVSSRGSRTVDAQSVWAFYFEEKRAEEVARRQQSALDRIDWAVFAALQGKEPLR